MEENIRLSLQDIESEIEATQHDFTMLGERTAKIETGFAALAKAHSELVDCVKELRSSLSAHVNHS